MLKQVQTKLTVEVFFKLNRTFFWKRANKKMSSLHANEISNFFSIISLVRLK
jgi:hypothetical protein